MKKLSEYFEDPETGLPYNVEIGENSLPREINCKEGYGSRFNVYINEGGAHYHRAGCRYIKSKARIFHRYIAASDYIPCRHCRPLTKIDYWYEEYMTRSQK